MKRPYMATGRGRNRGGWWRIFIRSDLDDELAHDLRRPQWMWVAVRGGLLAGRAVGGPAGR
jgi:hypothetical protein